MIIVRVELLSAINGTRRELARMHISNLGGSAHLGDYKVETLRGRDELALDRRVVQRSGKVVGHARLALHVWALVAKALGSVGYAGGPPSPPPDQGALRLSSCEHCGKPATTTRCGVGGCPLGADL